MAIDEKRETCGKSSPFVCYSAFLSLSTNNKKLVRSANEKKQRRASSFQMGSLFTSSHPSLMSLPLVFFFVLLLQLLSVVNGRNQSEPSYTPLNRDLYRSSGVLANEIKTLVGRHPDILSMEKMTAQNKGYNAEIFVVTYNSSRKAFNESSKFRILLSFGQHGRELITSELAVQLLSALCKEKSIPNVDVSSLNDLLEMIVLKVVPIENLNGRKLVEAGNLCERRNGRGVDLNRNWGVDWGKKEKDYDPHEENPGTAPFSEPETQIMRKLSKSFDPHIWITIHSGMEALFMPYDHRNTTPDGLATHVMKSMLDDVNRLHCKDRCLVGSGGGSVGYLAHGTATDYMYDVMKVPMAFTFEIYGDKLASSNDCFRMFNPIDRTSVNRVLNDWTAALFTMFKMGPHWMDLAHFNSSKLESIDEYLEGYLIERSSRYGKRMEVIDLGMQEIRTYFRLFLLSSVLLMFMFCSRITKSKYATLRTAVSL